MIYNVTFCWNATCSWTRISTFLIWTCFILWTFWINETFRSAIWWTSDVRFNTRTNCLRIYFSTATIWTAWCWMTWIYIYRCCEIKKRKMKNENNFSTLLRYFILWSGLHWTKAFPSIPSGQRHIGIWLMTSHRAFWAHVPGHGLTHLLLRQAFSLEQSELRTHSGRHPV